MSYGDRLKRLNILLSLSLLCALAYASELLSFEALVQGDDSVLLQWEVDDTQDLSGFVLQRSVNNTHFHAITQVLPISGSYYEYIDRPGLAGGASEDKHLRLTDIDQDYYYHLEAVHADGRRTQLSESAVHVSFEMSTVDVTWGSIKAMFR
jgi:hypothetical protein